MIKTKSTYKSKRTFSWVSDKTIVKDTKKYGMGIYANKKIGKGEKIAVFGGHIMTRKEEDKTPSNIYDNAIQLDDDLVIGAVSKDEIEDATMFNHSCNANAGLKGQILLVAMKDILPGEQITLDFGTVLFHSKGVKKYKFKCLCGSSDCRGTITDNDWKIEAVQKKYDGYFSMYLQEKINNIK